ncbi:MAG: DUF255 domain-containing protein [Nitrospirae bacterium]|nr:DUF255 domain-containing protein [Nitrospirota bacterium]
MNKLSKERSAYLKHSAYQKIDWYPWSDEAFDRAKKEDKPVFLSTGAIWCHWCHVMAKECFENDEIVRLLNENFINRLFLIPSQGIEVTVKKTLDSMEKAIDQEARKIFKELSAWEGRHMGFIGFLYQSIQQDRDIIGFEKFTKKADASVTEAGIPVKDLEEKLQKYDFIDDMGALILALEIEGKAYNLYRKMSQSAADTNAKVVFHEMMEQETKHIDYLKKLRLRLFETS